jgi:hypothetical protein
VEVDFEHGSVEGDCPLDVVGGYLDPVRKAIHGLFLRQLHYDSGTTRDRGGIDKANTNFLRRRPCADRVDP